MAEERLIDDDKDRKYKIRKNADGEDELVIDDTPEEESEEEELGFEVPEFDEDDEELAVMTPEQLAEQRRLKEEAELRRKEEIKNTAKRARQLIADGKYEDANYILSAVEGPTGDDAEVSALKLIAITREFTDYTDAEDGLFAVQSLKTGITEELREELTPYLEGVNAVRAHLKEEVDALSAENEGKKDERRVRFKSRKKNSLIAFLITGIPLVVFAVLAIYYSTIMYAEKDGSNITLFIVFVSLAGVFLIASLITARRLWQSANLLKLNENNSSTKLGRQLEDKKSQLEFVEKISEVIAGGNDIS
ncbi:MAG: YrzE family protein [Clostridia bacterium]|nr:YrzE family protein [Clostridia bacterium]